MKNIALVFLISIAFPGCKSVEREQFSGSNIKTESNSVKGELTPTTEEQIAALTKKQQQKLDERIPPKIRETLDKADEINVYYNIDKETKTLGILRSNTVLNAGATISDASLKKRFLESFYYDSSSDETGAMCYMPRHKVTAKYNNRTVELDICYECQNFKGISSNGKISGTLAYESKSALIIKEVIEKYGTELQ